MKTHRTVICILLLLTATPLTATAAGSPSGRAAATGAPTSRPDDLPGIYRAMRDGRLPLLPGRSIYVHSETDKKRLRADVYSIVHYRLADLSRALARPQNWCRFVTLHLNVKACTCSLQPDPVLSIYAGRKFYQSPQEATRMDYRFQVVEQDSQRLVVLLTAAKGELSTRDYRFRIETQRMNADDVLLHFSLSYRQSLTSRMATRAYLSTLGRDKVGFSRQPGGTDGNDYVKGVRGIVERNAMRYYLALAVYMNTLDATGPRTDYRRCRTWFDLTQRYARQLREVDRTEYLLDKRREFENQRILQARVTDGCGQKHLPAVQQSNGK